MSALPTFASTIQQILATPAPASSSSWMKSFGNSPAVNAFSQATDAANLANFNRGQQGIGLLAGMGQASKQENQIAFGQGVANIDQDMVNRGLFNTSAGNDAKLQATKQLTQQNNMVDQNTAGGVANALLSFQDNAPNVNLLADLLKQNAAVPKIDPYGETLDERWDGSGSYVKLNNGMWKNRGNGMVSPNSPTGW